MASPNDMKSGDGLLVVDVQNCFMPGGELPIEDGDEVVPKLNRWIDSAVEKGIPLYFSRDYHSKRDISFQEQGGPWPPHCVQDTAGAAFHEQLKVPEKALLVTKGVRFDQDQNSVFDQTGFAAQLERDGVKRLWVGGLALDVCVKQTVIDALEFGFEVQLIENATRPTSSEAGMEAVEDMRKAGAEIVEG